MAYYSNNGRYSGDDTGSNVGINGSVNDLNRFDYHPHYQHNTKRSNRRNYNDDDGLLIRTENSRVRDLDIHSSKPIYLVEHLATFTLNREAGIVVSWDGMKKLLDLEETTGIWPQKMKLCFDNHWILIMDYETEDIIERFPATLIREPTAYMSKSPSVIYNNIFVFIVAIDSESDSRSEMHLFQSTNVSAILLVDDLKHLRNGGIVTHQHNQLHHGNQSQTEADSETDSTDGSVSIIEKYERDIKLLNHCFDDIERFIIRLKHVAAASRELNQRQRNRNTQNINPGEGILAVRTRPPFEKDFIDIFEKFKLAFNLLAKLKAHINDPNAPELVHFLFTPLALTVEAVTESYAELNLPENCIKPLLTTETINFLLNCMTPKEMELWRSLGDCWTISKEHWNDSRADVSSDFEGTHNKMISELDIQNWLRMLESRYAKIAQVTYPRTANNNKELTVFRGEYLEIIDGTRNWWKVRNIKGEVGHVPHTIVTPYNLNTIPPDNHRNNAMTGPPKKLEFAQQTSFCPPPPPPPPQHQTNAVVYVKREKIDTNEVEEEKNSTGNNNMQEELKQALSLFREKRKKQQDRFINLDLIKTPECFIQEKSDPKDIENWLKLKGFSERSQKVLSGLNGEQLFSLNNQNLEELCGKKEAKRLESQILIQKKFSGFKTARSTELFAVLARVREKMEKPKDDVNKKEEEEKKELDNENF